SPAMKGSPKVTIDVSDDSDAKAWADDAQKIVSQWFPLVWQLLATEDEKPPKSIKLVFRKKQDAPAYASGGAISVNGAWIAAHPEDFGMMVHELTHLVQGY